MLSARTDSPPPIAEPDVSPSLIRTRREVNIPLQLMRNLKTLVVILLIGAGCRQNGRTPAPGPRVVSLAPSITEMICAVGAASNLVGRTTACDYPPEVVRNIPAIGNFGAPSIEALVALAPTVVLDVDLEDKSMSAKIRAAGLRSEHVRCLRIDDIPPAIIRVAELAGKPAEGVALASGIARAIAEARAAQTNSTARPRVYVEIWNDPLMTVGADTFVADVVRLAGGDNIGDEVRGKDYFPVASEWVVSRNPDVILCFSMKKQPSASTAISSRTGWSTMSAVKNNRIYSTLDPDRTLRPGPRVMEAVEELRLCLKPPPG